MGIPDTLDVIVCGGGPAGCAVAGRLAAADPKLQVLLIEAGQNQLNDPWVYRPGIFPNNMRLDQKKATFYKCEPSGYLLGRRAIVPAAHVLGGGSSINFASDWDDFHTDGWRADQLLPYMRKLETYQRPCQNPELHGFEGPVKMSFGGYITPLAHDFLRAAESIDIPFTNDLQDLKTAHGSETKQTNLHLKCNSRISRILFEGNKAVGVEYVPSVDRADDHKTRVVRARKQIVLSGGTLGTPQILQRSGIGEKKYLEGLGIKVISDLPYCGRNYQDHYLHFVPFRADPDEFTTDDFLRGNKEVQERLFKEYETTGKGLLASNGIDAGAKLRPTDKENEEMSRSWPEWKEGYNSYFAQKPDKPVMFTSIISGFFGDHNHVPPGKYFTFFQYLEYPFSRGAIQIRSKNPYDTPIFDAGFLNDSRDIPPMVWGYKVAREIARRMDGFRGELTSLHPHFHPQSPARCIDIDLETSKKIGGPHALSAGIAHGNWAEPMDKAKHEQDRKHNIVYSKEDDKAIEQWVREHTETTWHSLGTCAMRKRDDMGVVDERLDVYGVQNLKCVDLSVCPDNLGTNTYSSALLVGEKGAALIAEDLDLKNF